MNIHTFEWQDFKVDVPTGSIDDWEVSHFSVDDQGASMHNIREVIHGSRGLINTGKYTKLTHRGDIVMSDTPSEIRDHYHPICNARGNVLVAGLGLGVVTGGILKSDPDTVVTVVEKSHSVIQLVAPHYRAKYGDRFNVVMADIYEWKPLKGVKYDYTWFDIWPDICGDNWEKMKTLKRRFAQKAKVKRCWQESETYYQSRRQW